MKNTILALSIVGIFCGCASAGRNYDSRKVAEIQKGQTTESDLIKMFGQPEQRGINSDSQATMQWIYSESTTKGATFVPVVGLFAGGVDTKTKVLNVCLTNGIVCSFNYSGGGFDVVSHTSSDPEDDSTPASAPKNRK